MILSKTGLAIAVSALLFSGSSLAFNGVDDGNGNAQWDDSANTTNTTNTNTLGVGIDDSFNQLTDNSDNLDVEVDDSFNDDTTNNTNTTLGVGIDDSFNEYEYTDNSDTLDVEIDDSFNDNSTNDSYNTDDSYNTLSVSTDMVVASSTLNGTAAGLVIYTNTDDFADIEVGNYNSIDGMSGVAGIVTVGQVAGANSLVQQSVVTNANLFTGE